jgi:hypothetical protein
MCEGGSTAPLEQRHGTAGKGSDIHPGWADRGGRRQAAPLKFLTQRRWQQE